MFKTFIRNLNYKWALFYKALKNFFNRNLVKLLIILSVATVLEFVYLIYLINTGA